jgi:(p)ppGpp synthase/HD superfamily hydrolase
MEERDGLTSSMIFIITVKNRHHLAQVMRRIKSINSVMRISRKKN